MHIELKNSFPMENLHYKHFLLKLAIVIKSINKYPSRDGHGICRTLSYIRINLLLVNYCILIVPNFLD